MSHPVSAGSLPTESARAAVRTAPPAGERERPKSGWIISPLWDLAFLVATPLVIVPVLTVLARRAFTPEQISLVVISFASLGHHLPGFMRAYGDAELFRRFRWRFLAAPPVILATALTFAWFDLNGLSLVLLFWSTWHGLMQTYGFMRIYDLKRGVADRWSAGLDFSLCLSLFVAGVVFSDARMFGIADAFWQCGMPPLGADWLRGGRWLVGGATVAVLASYAVHVGVRGWRGRGVTWNKLLLAATTGWLFWVSGSISTNILVGVAMFEVFHAVQYYAIVWVYNRKLADRVGRRFGPLGFLFRHRWTFLFLYLAAIAAYGGIRFLGAQVPGDTFQKLLLAILTTSTLLHFYYDGFIWKVRESETSANLDIDPTLSPWQRLRVPAVRHLAKWSLLFAVLGGLLWLELRVPTNPTRQAWQLKTLAAWMPELPEVKLRLASDALRRGQPEQAITWAREAAAARPRSHQAHFLLGQALLVAGHDQPAVEALETAVGLRPGDVSQRRELARAHRRMGDWERAEQQLLRVRQMRPGNPRGARDLGLLAMERGDLEAAVEHFRQALRLAPASLESRAKLVESLIALERLAEAERCSEEGLRLQPQSPRARLISGQVAIAQRKFDQAIQHLDVALQTDADSLEVQYQWGVATMHAGRTGEATECFRRILEREPDHALAHYQLGNLAFLAGAFAEAERWFERSGELRPEFPDAWHNRGAAQYRQGRVQASLESYREALRRAPERADWHHNFGLLLLELGRSREAWRHLVRARSLGAELDAATLRYLTRPPIGEAFSG